MAQKVRKLRWIPTGKKPPPRLRDQCPVTSIMDNSSHDACDRYRFRTKSQLIDDGFIPCIYNRLCCLRFEDFRPFFKNIKWHPSTRIPPNSTFWTRKERFSHWKMAIVWTNLTPPWRLNVSHLLANRGMFSMELHRIWRYFLGVETSFFHSFQPVCKLV